MPLDAEPPVGVAAEELGDFAQLRLRLIAHPALLKSK
jgi:hypothetical protein